MVVRVVAAKPCISLFPYYCFPTLASQFVRTNVYGAYGTDTGNESKITSADFTGFPMETADSGDTCFNAKFPFPEGFVPGTWSQIGAPLTYWTRDQPSLAVFQTSPATNPRTLFIYDTVTIGNAVGGAGNDELTGNAANNRLTGGGGTGNGNDAMGNIEKLEFSVGLLL